MSFWKEPEPPPVEKMPRRRPEKKPSLIGRALAGLAGAAFGTTSIMGLLRSLDSAGPRSSPFMSLALLIPTVVLVRYAATGKIIKP